MIALGLKGQNKVRWVSWDQASEKINKGNKKFLVYIYYNPCKWCKQLEERTLNNDHVAKFINNNFYALNLNAMSSDKIVLGTQSFTTVRIGKYDFHELSADLLSGDMTFPAIVILDENFRKIGIWDGYLDVFDMEMRLSYYTGNHHKNTIWRKYANNYCRESHFHAHLVDHKE